MLVAFVPECRVPALLSIISKLTDPKAIAAARTLLQTVWSWGCVQSAKRARSSSARGDKPLPAWVLGLGGGGEQLEKVLRARCRFGSRRGGSSVEKVLQFFLAIS